MKVCEKSATSSQHQTAPALQFSKRVPLGVVALITPWNFPVAIPIWKAAPALIYRNTVVLKPTTEAAVTAAKIVECFDQADFPNGVINLVTGKGSVIGQGLAEHPDIEAVSFRFEHNRKANWTGCGGARC